MFGRGTGGPYPPAHRRLPGRVAAHPEGVWSPRTPPDYDAASVPPGAEPCRAAEPPAIASVGQPRPHSLAVPAAWHHDRRFDEGRVEPVDRPRSRLDGRDVRGVRRGSFRIEHSPVEACRSGDLRHHPHYHDNAERRRSRLGRRHRSERRQQQGRRQARVLQHGLDHSIRARAHPFRDLYGPVPAAGGPLPRAGGGGPDRRGDARDRGNDLDLDLHDAAEAAARAAEPVRPRPGPD